MKSLEVVEKIKLILLVSNLLNASKFNTLTNNAEPVISVFISHIWLDFKFNPDHLGANNVNEHVTCHEYNLALPFELSSTHVFETLAKMIPIKCPEPYTYDEFLKINNLKTLLILDKKRTTYEDDLFVIALDEFTDFGTFIELEAKDNNMQKEAFLSEVAKATKGMTVTEFDSGYIELRLRQINEQLYLKGKYLIDSEVAAWVTFQKYKLTLLL